MSQLIIKPILSEKSNLLNQQKKHVFQVARHANKISIKQAIEKRFDVKVGKVAIINMKGKTKSMTIKSSGKTLRTEGRRSAWKKAIVTLKEGTIDIVHGDFQS